MIEYPTRCRIIDVIGKTFHGFPMRTPEASKPHIGKEGLAKLVPPYGGVRITLDDGTVFWGYECWWEPLP